MKKVFFILLVGFISLQAGDILKTFNFKDTKGNPITMQAMNEGVAIPEFKGKVVLINFFGYYCPPCLKEIPHLTKIQEEYKDKFQIVALQVQKRMQKQQLDDFIKNHNINYPVISMADIKVFDFIDFITAKTGWKGMIPFMILLDQNGNAITTYLGLQREETLIRDIKSLIK